MATSSYPHFQVYSPFTQVVLHASLKNAQAFAMIAPPIYLLSSLVLRRGRPFSVSRLMRASTRSTIAGAGIGALAGWGRLRNEPLEALEDRAQRLRYNAGQVETDDFSFIGATLGGIIVPAIFLRRASLPSLVFGGASIGLGAGTLTHIVRMFTQGEDIRPEGMVGEIPVIGGNDKK